MHPLHPEDFSGVVKLYDDHLIDNSEEHQILYPKAYGLDEYIGQYSDNTASDLRRMARLMNLRVGSRVLDGGCGPGAVACLLAKEFGWSVRGVDISRRHLAIAVERANRSPVRNLIAFDLVNLYDVEESDLYDGAYGTGAWCHFDAERLFPKLRRLIRPGGRIGFMERVARGPSPPAAYEAATRDWACPAIYSAEEYERILSASGFESIAVHDMSERYKDLQRAQVQTRIDHEKLLIEKTSNNHFRRSLALAKAECDLTEEGLLGYALITATRI